MLIDLLLELKNNINEHGIRWGVAFTVYALFRKERRNIRLDRRDDAIFHNQRIIMAHLGLGDQYRGQVTLSEADRQSFKKFYSSLQGAIQWGSQLRRGKRMNQQINYVSLFAAVLGAMKIILQSVGIEIPDEHINSIVNGAAAIVTIIGIFMSHRKGESANVNARSNDTIGSSK
jgi:uncharacterized membrane protein